MTRPRTLPGHRTCYRIGDPDGEYPVFSAEGARQVEGRWHQRGDAVIYAAEHYSLAMLEKLAHWNGVLPANQHFVEITLPAGLSYEVVTGDRLPGWHEASGEVARAYGHDWYRSGRTAVLFVPSVVARIETTVVLNTRHPEFARVTASLETPVVWDDRLYR